MSVNLPDSVTTDSVTVHRSRRKASDLQGPIDYEAQIIENWVDEKITVLTGRARVKYLDIALSAAKITVDWDKRELMAEGAPDTVWTATEDGDSVRTEQWKGIPEFTEAGNVMIGDRMLYNFKTRKAYVERGRTEYDAGYYRGRAMKLMDKKNIYVGDAAFTTCDKPQDTHFHFSSKQMKIMVNDKVIAKPVIMYIGKIPVMALPFALFPIKKGRHSGLLIPRYGESAYEGRSLRGLGYYWVLGEYWDARTTVNYYEKSGFLFRGDTRYHKRDVLRGSISGNFTRKDFETDGRKERRWDLNVQHDHTISPTTNIRVNARLVSSDNIYRDLSANRTDRMRGQILSNATFTRRIGTSGNLSVNMNQTRNLRQDTTTFHVSETMPQISFSNRWSNLIGGKRTSSGREVWYRRFSLPYSFDFKGLRNRTTYQPGHGETQKSEGVGADHRLNLYVSPKLFGWLNLKPQLNYNETWTDRRNRFELDTLTNTFEEKEERGFYTVRTFNANMSANTKIYGLFRSGFFPDVQVRHVITPTVSFRYQPDFTDDAWGYYVSMADTNDAEVRKNPYSGVGAVSPSLGSEQQSLSFSINNVFQMKKGEGEKARKMELFTFNTSGGYNWKAKTHKMQNLQSSLRARLLGRLNLNMSTTHSFYRYTSQGIVTDALYTDGIDWTDWKSLRKARLAKMTNMTWSLDFSLKGKAGSAPSRTSGPGITPETVPGEDLSGDPFTDSGRDPFGSFSGDRFEPEDAESGDGFSIPWNFSTRISYSKGLTRRSKNVYTKLNLDFRLTKNWKVTWRSHVDLKTKKMSSQDFVIYRDLHCWEAQVNWTPTGRYKRVYLKINIKSSMLQDIKVEKRSGRMGYYGY